MRTNQSAQPAVPRRDPPPSRAELDDRYGKIGISAVAAAIPFQNELRGPDCAHTAPTTYSWSLAVAE